MVKYSDIRYPSEKELKSRIHKDQQHISKKKADNPIQKWAKR